MTLQAILEENREHLMSALSGADAPSAVRVLSGELDRILYTFVDQEERAGVREAAGSMIQTAKAAASLIDSAGETKIFGRIEYGESAPGKKKPSTLGLVLLIAGLIGAAVTVIGVQLLATSAAAGSADWESAGETAKSGIAPAASANTGAVTATSLPSASIIPSSRCEISFMPSTVFCNT